MKKNHLKPDKNFPGPLYSDICQINIPFTQELDTDEEFARLSLRSCIDLARIWTPKSDVITYLWEYFHKKLVSNSFHIAMFWWFWLGRLSYRRVLFNNIKTYGQEWY